MNCTACRLPSAYNRAVVDTLEGETIGCLCTSCIEEFFGHSLDATERTDIDCLLCDRDGFYALPKWRCETETDGNRVTLVGLEVTIDATTPRLCESHFFALREGATGTERERTATLRDRL